MLPALAAKFPSIFIPWILMHNVEYFGKHLSLRSHPLRGFPAYTPTTISFILLYKMGSSTNSNTIPEHHMPRLIFFSFPFFFVIKFSNLRNSNSVCSLT